MSALTPADLMTLEAWSKQLKANKPQLMAHRRARTVHLGEHITLQFEDRATVQYQVQEMLRIEKIFEEEGIQGELDAYNPLIPDGSNWKATMLIEYPEVDERRVRLAELKGIEDLTWVQVADHAKVFAIADEDLERENDEKTSSVHFLRFELSPGMKMSLRGGASLSVGIDHASYKHANDPVSSGIRDSLLNDLKFPT